MNQSARKTDTTAISERLHVWLVLVAAVWLLAPTNRSQWSAEASSSEWSLGIGWGEWLSLTREGFGPYGDVTWQQYTIGVQAGWSIVVPLLLLAAGLALACSQGSRHALARCESFLVSREDTFRRWSRQLLSATATGLVAVLLLGLLLPAQHRTEFMLHSVSNIEQARQAVSSRLTDIPGVRSFSVEQVESRALRVQVEAWRWLAPVNTPDQLSLQDLDAGVVSDLSFATRAHPVAMPLGIVIGLLSLLLLARRQISPALANT